MATTCLHWVRIFEMNLVNKWLVNYFFRDSNPLYSRKMGLSFGTDSFSCLFEENTFLGAQSKNFGNFYCCAELNFPHSFFCCHCTPPLHVSWHKLAVRGICGHKTIFSSVVERNFSFFFLHFLLMLTLQEHNNVKNIQNVDARKKSTISH